MTGALTIRVCSTCGAREDDLGATFVFDQASDEIVHLIGNGLYRCGVLVALDDEVKS